jgi:hypothetical protein
MENTKILFARIGYMKYYQGPQKDDEQPIRGGSFNKHKIGHEVFNFMKTDGTIYGYFKASQKDYINLKRIDPKAVNQDRVDNVLVIWFAPNPIDKGQVIVGWYKNATVYRSLINRKQPRELQNYSYNVSCSEENAILLPITKRKYQMGHNIKTKLGNPGQANAFYIFDDKLNLKDFSSPINAWIPKAIEYVESYNGPSISTFEDVVAEEINTTVFASGGQGFQSDIKKRLIIEKYAMDECRKYFENKGYKLKNVSNTHSYDFEATKSGKKILIEVKGTETAGNKIILTKKEVDIALKYSDKMILFLVHSIILEKNKVKSKKVKKISPWKIDKSKLTPISYSYKF